MQQAEQRYSKYYSEVNTFYIKFTLDDNSTTPLLLDFPDHGIFEVLIRPTENPSRTHCKFHLSKSLHCGPSVGRYASASGVDKEQFDMSWEESGVHIQYRPAPKTQTFTEYIMKVTTV